MSVGDKKCQDTLRTSLAMGADRAILVETDGETQPLSVAKILGAVALKEQVQLVVLGKQAIDGDNGQTAGMLGAVLAWPQALCASKVLLFLLCLFWGGQEIRFSDLQDKKKKGGSGS